MKKILFIVLLLFVGSTFAEDRLGPDVTDYYLDVGIGILAANTSISNQDTLTGGAIAAGLWYVKYEIDLGLEAIVTDWGQGGFLSAKYPIQDYEIQAGIGYMGYEVESITDYYTHEPVLLLGASYQTGYGKIIFRYLVSQTDKNHYSTTSITQDIELASWPHTETITRSTKTETDNTYRTIGVGFQVDY